MGKPLKGFPPPRKSLYLPHTLISAQFHSFIQEYELGGNVWFNSLWTGAGPGLMRSTMLLVLITLPCPSWLCTEESCTSVGTWQSWSEGDYTARDGQGSPAVTGYPKVMWHIPVAGFFSSGSDSCLGWSVPSSHTRCVQFPRGACISVLWQSRDSNKGCQDFS